MSYRPLQIDASKQRSSTTSLMAKKGLNKRDLPQLLSPENALTIKNYLITAEGGLEKRGGLEPVVCFPTGDATNANLEGYWRLDEGTGTTAVDTSSNGRDGTLVSAPAWADGKIGKCLDFNDNEDKYVSIAHDAVFNSASLTISFWVYLKSYSTTTKYFFGKRSCFSAYVTNGFFRFSTDFATLMEGRLNLDEWTNITVSHNSSTNTSKIYKNGVLNKEQSGVAYTPSGSYNFLFARHVINSGFGTFTYKSADCKLDEVRYYSSALTDSEISELYCSSSAITMSRKWTDNLYVVGYGKNLAVYDKTLNNISYVKTDFVENGFSGEKYSNYFLAASPGDKINRLSFTLDYDTQTANFTVGDVVTGTTSGATALILEDSDSGASGTLTLGNVSGTFEDNEAITDPDGGAAVVNGYLKYTSTEITNAPKAKVIKVISNRLFAANLAEDSTAVRYSFVDDGTNPPFDDWAESTAADEGGLLNYRNAGDINVIENLGEVVIIGAEEGKWAFYIDTIDSSGTLTKIDRPVMYRIDKGMKAALQTSDGIWYVNSQGLWNLQSVGQSDIKSSDQEFLVSKQLGDDYFINADFSNGDLLKDDVTNQLLITYAEDSTSNNKVLVYNTELKAYAEFTGWNISSFLNDGNLYGGGSNKAKIWQILEGSDDDGADIWTEFEQELSVGQLWTRKEMQGQYMQGLLSPSTSLDIAFDIYDRDGVFIGRKLILQWTPETGTLDAGGYGELGWGTDGWGGNLSSAGTVENFNGAHERIKNFQRIRVNISGHDKVPHTINWFSILTKEKIDIRKRGLQNIT